MGGFLGDPHSRPCELLQGKGEDELTDLDKNFDAGA